MGRFSEKDFVVVLVVFFVVFFVVVFVVVFIVGVVVNVIPQYTQYIPFELLIAQGTVSDVQFNVDGVESLMTCL